MSSSVAGRLRILIKDINMNRLGSVTLRMMMVVLDLMVGRVLVDLFRQPYSPD